MPRAGISNTQADRPYRRPAPAVHTQSKVAPKPTDEQAQALAIFQSGEDLVLKAGAGCGKTSTLAMMARTTKRQGSYIAFNKALVEDSRGKFPSNVQCSTIHSPAWRAVVGNPKGEPYKKRLEAERVKPAQLAAMLDLTVGVSFEKLNSEFRVALSPSTQTVIVREAVNRFCQSAEKEPKAEHIPWQRGLSRDGNRELRETLLPYVKKFWDDAKVPTGALPLGKSLGSAVYLKLFELKHPTLSGDYLLIDEAQDLSPVMISIAKKQSKIGTQLVFVGDDFQQIYGFTGAVNAMQGLDYRSATLSQSFRFGQPIADVANTVLANIPGHDFKLKGWGDQSSVGKVKDPKAVLTRTNALAVEALLESGKKVHIVGGGQDMISFCYDAEKLQRGERVQHPDLACFENWAEVKQYVRDGGDDLKLIVSLVDRFGGARIARAIQNMPPEDQAEVVYSTAHKSKGREWDTVQLASDFVVATRCECKCPEKVHPGGGECSKCDDCPIFTPKTNNAEEMRLLYVGVTRAMKRLDVGPLHITKNGVSLVTDLDEEE